MRTFTQDTVEWAATLDIDTLITVTRAGQPIHVADADHDRDFQPLCATDETSGSGFDTADIVCTPADCPDCQRLLELAGHIVHQLFDLPVEYTLKFTRIGQSLGLTLATQARSGKELSEQVTAYARQFLRCADYDVVLSLDACSGVIFCGKWRVGSFTITDLTDSP